MGITGYGWVELQNEETRRWSAVIDIEPLNLRDYIVFGSVFGVLWGSSDASREPFAVDRGIPDDTSYSVREEADVNVGSSHTHHSWVLWSELVDTWIATERQSPRGLPITAAWLALRDMMAALGRVYGGDNVRLVIWFS